MNVLRRLFIVCWKISARSSTTITLRKKSSGTAVNYLHELGGRQEAALLAAGLGLEHFLDLRQDAIDAAAHRETGTPRTIEGPLYVANAPLAEGARPHG